MPAHPTVSCIVIFLNGEKYLAEAIESVLAQRFQDWELLLIDDGSTDKSTSIAQNYAASYPNQIRYLHHPDHQNLGKSTSRNLGIRQACGDYLIFLDGDDVLLPDKMERQVALLETHPRAGMVYGTTLYWYSWTGKAEDVQRDYLGKLGVGKQTLFEPLSLLDRYLQDGGIVPCLCAPLMRRTLVDSVGGFDEALQHLYEDQLLLAKLCLAAPVLIETACGEKYRQHAESSSFLAIQNKEYHPLWPNPARNVFLSQLVHYLDEQRIDAPAIRQRIEREQWLFDYPAIHYPYTLLQYCAKYGQGYLQALWAWSFKKLSDAKRSWRG